MELRLIISVLKGECPTFSITPGEYTAGEKSEGNIWGNDVHSRMIKTESKYTQVIWRKLISSVGVKEEKQCLFYCI